MVRAVLVFLIAVTTALFPSMQAEAQLLFEYSHIEGDQWHLTSVVDEEVLVNGELVHRAEILNKISVEILDGTGSDGRLWNRYQISEKSKESGIYKLHGEFEAEYSRNYLGILTDFKNLSPVPTVRNIPVFPDRVMNPGDRWSADGVELFDWNPRFEIPGVLFIDFTAEYEYIGPVVRDSKELEKIEIRYSYNWNLEPLSEDFYYLSQYSYYPVGISGDFHQLIFWDAEAGRNYASQGWFEYIYFLSNGENQTFRGTTRAKAFYTEPMDKTALMKEIEELADDNITVAVTDVGVSVSLEDIHFVPDEPQMLPGEETRLNDISEILSRYPGRDVLIIGHTAMVNPGSDGQLLSEQRAAAVAQYFIESGVRQETQVIIRGMGYKEPVGDNSTEEGRKKNRRVEIIILEN